MGLPRRSGDDRGPGSLVDAGRTVSMRALASAGLRLKGAGDATGLCCVKMMRGSRALEAPPRAGYGLREESAGVCYWCVYPLTASVM